MKLFIIIAFALSALAAEASTAVVGGSPLVETLDLRRFTIVQRESGPVNYYLYVEEPRLPFVRARYWRGLESAILGYSLDPKDRGLARTLEWKWRILKFPQGADECVSGKGDAAAAVSLIWKRGMKWYELRYVWGSTEAKGKWCDQKRSLFSARDTIILESGGVKQSSVSLLQAGLRPIPWVAERVELRQAFIEHFEKGNPGAAVPDFVGIGLSTDGDQTKSESAADYAAFKLGLDK